VLHRNAHEVGFREAAAWSTVWIALALAFGVALYRYPLWPGRSPSSARYSAPPSCCRS